MQRTESNQCYDIGEGAVRQVQKSDWLTDWELLELTDCKYLVSGWKGDGLIFYVQLVKCVLLQLTVMKHIAVKKR